VITQLSAEVLANDAVGGYRRLRLAAPPVAATAAAGQFIACAVGDDDGTGALLLRRAFSLHRADPGTGSVEIVVAAHAPGTTWIAQRRPGCRLDIVGPAGRPFTEPDRDGGAAVLVGGGYGAAPLGWLAQRLRSRSIRAEIITGAARQSRLFGHDDPPGDPGLGSVTVLTEDGSAGRRGRVTDVLAEVVDASGADVVYACGPMPMLRAVHEVADRLGVASQLAVEESMACGIGVCMTCVLPVVGDDGLTRMSRSCVEGPVFAGDRLRWDAIVTEAGRTTSRVPDDCVGAPVPAGHWAPPPAAAGGPR
jgi:dihydroorotate dehydrogenase electron transfer subunit